MSAYVAAALRRQIERGNLNELVTGAEAEHGPVTDVEIQSLRDQLIQARREQTQHGANAA
ncbi:CopG family transcriptional regulator [Streptomyces chrestomyceticus]|uniref:CopG family transcriptional regulator n=1 Tax=Streptomyces chrestomyceticus TaxID=68185 RepID=A0ABU7X4F6_9ACTN